MATRKRKPTQADLNAANAEARGYLNQVQLLKRAESERNANILREQDDAILASFCKLIKASKLPPNIAAIAAWSSLDRSELASLTLWVGDMKRLAEAIERRMVL